MAADKIYPDSGAVPSAPAPPGANYNVKDQSIPPPGPPGAYYNVKDQFPPAPGPPGAHDNAKDQPIPPPATYQDRQRGRSSSCRNCVIAVVAIHILIGLAILIFWLVVHPRAPRFDVKSVQIEGLTETNPANTTITYSIDVRNPNKKRGFYYSDINVKVEASGDIIGQETVGGFYQGHKNTTSLNRVIGSLNVVLGSDAITSITRDRSNVPIYAQMDLKVKVKGGSIKTRKRKVKKVKVKCDIKADLTVTSGSQLKSSNCKVNW